MRPRLQEDAPLRSRSFKELSMQSKPKTAPAATPSSKSKPAAAQRGSSSQQVFYSRPYKVTPGLAELIKAGKV
jgi:hypothetical protein